MPKIITVKLEVDGLTEQLRAEAVRVVDDSCDQCGAYANAYHFKSEIGGMDSFFCLPCLAEDESVLEVKVVAVEDQAAW